MIQGYLEKGTLGKYAKPHESTVHTLLKGVYCVCLGGLVWKVHEVEPFNVECVPATMLNVYHDSQPTLDLRGGKRKSHNTVNLRWFPRIWATGHGVDI